jgi:hypothetical protein
LLFFFWRDFSSARDLGRSGFRWQRAVSRVRNSSPDAEGLALGVGLTVFYFALSEFFRVQANAASEAVSELAKKTQEPGGPETKKKAAERQENCGFKSSWHWVLDESHPTQS